MFTFDENEETKKLVWTRIDVTMPVEYGNEDKWFELKHELFDLDELPDTAKSSVDFVMKITKDWREVGQKNADASEAIPYNPNMLRAKMGAMWFRRGVFKSLKERASGVGTPGRKQGN